MKQIIPLFLMLLFSAAQLQAAEAPTEFQKNAALFVAKCGKCHTVGGGDRVGPDLKDVSRRRDKEWLIGFIQKPSNYLNSDAEAKKLLEKYNGVRMEDLGLPRATVEGLLEYIDAASAGPIGPKEIETLEPQDPYTKLAMPEEGFSTSPTGVLLLIALLFLAGGLWQIDFHKGSAVLILIALLVAYWSFGGRQHHRLLGNQQGYAPIQPIHFSHKQHAGDMRIACMYCHHGAEKSDIAGVPSADICMNCHTAVKKVANADTESTEIAKLASVWNSRLSDDPKSIEWTRVHKLPDYVHFSHKVHVRNNIQCQECHGPVQTMERMRQASNLSMGWCVNCHRKDPGMAPTHWKRSGATLDCAACHW